MNCSVEIEWGDGVHTFRLLIRDWEELRDKCFGSPGPPELYERVANRRWHAGDLREIVRVGLIGGGLAPVEALRLVRRYVDDRPLIESLEIAAVILRAGLLAPENDEPKKANGEAMEAHGASPIYTERAP